MQIKGEIKTEEFLRKEGFDIAKSIFISRKKDLKNIKINFPWVIKVVSDKILHKRREGGIRLNVITLKKAETAFDNFLKLQGARGILVQEMLKSSSPELILGLEYTEDFGECIMLGKGGSNVEEEKDVSFRVLPISKRDAESMIKDLRIRVRNKRLVLSSLLKLGKIGKRYKQIRELDINPLFIIKNKAIIADARMVLK